MERGIRTHNLLPDSLKSYPLSHKSLYNLTNGIFVIYSLKIYNFQHKKQKKLVIFKKSVSPWLSELAQLEILRELTKSWAKTIDISIFKAKFLGIRIYVIEKILDLKTLWKMICWLLVITWKVSFSKSSPCYHWVIS